MNNNDFNFPPSISQQQSVEEVNTNPMQINMSNMPAVNLSDNINFGHMPPPPQSLGQSHGPQTQSSSSIISSTPSTSSDHSGGNGGNDSSSTSSSNASSNKRGISRCNDIPIQGLTQTTMTKSPPTKKRKKNGTTHSKLIEEFAQRSHIRNSVNLSSYHGKKQNIKTLCPYHDMLPVINVMEKEVFNNHKDNSIKKEYCNILPIIRNHCEWCCSGSPYKLECRNLLMRAKELYEYEFDFNEIALPFMNAVVLGGPNPNICIKLCEPDETKVNQQMNGQFNITFKPLQNLSLLERNDTCNVALKAISCGTFKRNLQPVPDACRITKLLDGDGCFVTVNDNQSNEGGMNPNNNSNKNIFFKVSTCEVRQRRKLQGTDSVLGVGFDCASRLSWQKPRIYWMHQSIHTLRDKKSKKIIEKKHISNRDLRFSVLVPYDFKGSMVIYMIGIQQDRHYTVNTNVPCKRYGNTNVDDNFNGINGYNPNLSVSQGNPIKNDTSSNNLPPSCFPDQDDDLNHNNNNQMNSSFPPSTRIPHPIQTQSTGSLTTNTSINDARNSPLSASTTTTSGPNSGVNGNSQIPPLPAISAQAPQFGTNANDNNNNSGFHPFPDSPTATNSFPPPPTNASLSTFNNDAATQNTNNMSIGSGSNNGIKDQFGNPINNMNGMNFNGMNNNNFNNGMAITGTVTAVDNNMNFNNNMNNMQNGIITTNNAPTYVNTSYNPGMNNMNTMPTTTYNIVPVNNMNNGMNMNGMNGMNMNMNGMNQMNQMNNFNNMNQMNMMNNGMNMNMNNMNSAQTIIDDAATQQMNGTVITNVNMNNNMNNVNYSVNNDPFSQMNQNGDNGDKSKYIDDDLENGRKNYLDLLRNVNFRDENYQTCASKWIRTCIEKYEQNQDIYHTYLLNLIQSLINSIGDDKTVRGLKRTWMSYNNIENEWSFLHMICSKNLLYLFQSILNLLQTYKHELLIAMTQIPKDSKLRISPLYCCIINNNHEFTRFLFDYYLSNLQSNDIAHILQNGTNDTNGSLVVQLMNHNHNATLQQIININASRNPQFLTTQQCQMIINKINPGQSQQNNSGSVIDTYSVNAFSK